MTATSKQHATPLERRVARALEAAAHLLPAQGPIEVFIHHNTLHALQHLPFHEAVREAETRLGGRGYLEEARFRALRAAGRIDDEALEEALALTGASEPAAGLVGRVRRLALLHGVPHHTAASLRWTLEEEGPQLRADLPADVRAALVARSCAALRRLLDEKTAAEIVEHLDGPGVVERTRAQAAARAEARRPERLLDRIGVPPPGRAAYLARVDALLGGAPSPRRRAAFLAGELEALGRLDERLGVGRSLTALRATIERQDPRLAAALLLAACRAALAEAPLQETPLARREALARATGIDPAHLVDETLIPLAAAFLDHGQAATPLPIDTGFLDLVRRVVPLGVLPAALRTLPAWLRRTAGRDAIGVAAQVLEARGQEHEAEQAVAACLDELPGWGGMFHRLESHPEERAVLGRPVSLADWLAVRLLLTAAAEDHLAARIGHTGGLHTLLAAARRIAPVAPPVDDRAVRVAEVLQLAGVPACELWDRPADVRAVAAALEAFDGCARRRVWQEAYEAHYRRRVLAGISAVRASGATMPSTPTLQVAVCIDDREESFRRALEEATLGCETFGVAGFFGVAIAFRGIDASKHAPFCPVVIRPRHLIEEEPLDDHAPAHATRLDRRRRWARLAEAFARHSRGLSLAGLLPPVVGPLAGVVLLARTLAPRGSHGWIRAAREAALPAPVTRLTPPSAAPARRGELQLGFTVDEEIACVEGTLRAMGLVSRFAPVVVFLGHGSRSVNNPHRSAYDCGACGGRRGGANARLFARFANSAEVRAALRPRGIVIPDETVFVGGVHDTCTDEVTLFLDDLPPERRERVRQAQAALEEARQCSAHERCRRFALAPRAPTSAEALRHVQARAVDLGEPRPELGHVTNASCIVGRRALTRGLFLDRRALLVSYDPTIDDAEGALLEGVMAAAVPVSAGINLEYYFSTVDNERWGAGTKLPHNVVGLLGVMSGARSDLRTGLPRQMVEIHEPMRMLTVVDAPPSRVAAVLERQPHLRELFGNAWAHLVVVDPADGRFHRYVPEQAATVPWQPAAWEVPRTRSSAAYYAGRTGFLDPALVAASGGPS